MLSHQPGIHLALHLLLTGDQACVRTCLPRATPSRVPSTWKKPVARLHRAILATAFANIGPHLDRRHARAEVGQPRSAANQQPEPTAACGTKADCSGAD